MIDLHCHILPGVDDGPDDFAASLDLARAAEAAGIRTIVATPHVREDYPFDYAIIPGLVEELNERLRGAGIGVEVLAGGEVALSMVSALGDGALAELCLGDGPYLLVESPYAYAADIIERELFDLQVRGFKPILAHPERSPSFSTDLARLVRLVERGILCQVTASSMTGRFGRTVRSFTIELFRADLVHDIASDAHDAVSRHPDLRAGLASLETELRGLSRSGQWFTNDVPAAVVQGRELPPRPAPVPVARRRWWSPFAPARAGASRSS